MNDLFVLAAHNTVAALVLALFVSELMRVWRSPPVAHVLWVLVLLKLVAPPAMHIDWLARLPSTWTTPPDKRMADSPPLSRQLAQHHSLPTGLAAETNRRLDESRRRAVGQETNPEAAPPAASWIESHATGADSFQLLWERVRPILYWTWVGGALLCASVAATRIVRFQRVLRDTLPASERLQRLAQEIADRFGVRRTPDLRIIACADVPFLWCVGRRATIVLPMGLLRQLDEHQAAMILAHELAHFRRRDHWVRGIELVVSTVYWWNPLAWAVRRRIHQAEDHCCDAWVRCAFPDCTRRYAELMLKTAELLSTSRVAARMLPASPFLHSLSLKARIEMILQSRFAPRLSTRSLIVVGLLALFALPSFVQSTKSNTAKGSSDPVSASNQRPNAAPDPATKSTNPTGITAPPTPADALDLQQRLIKARLAERERALHQLQGKSDAPSSSELPYAVRFEQGATRFMNGDKITIVEVQGTAETMTRGNIYRIKGTYTLASHDRATLSAYTTATNVVDGTGTPLSVQSTIVKRGQGTFTLFLPMTCAGWPHVSFYPDDGGGDFGGNYFGTGEFVLKHWWGSHEGESDEARAAFGKLVRFEQGATHFAGGDEITITEVRGTAGTFAPGNIYRVRGTYILSSHDRAQLLASTTASMAGEGKTADLKVTRTIVNRGTGEFTLYLPMWYQGWPHVSFYPAEGGDGFGGIYFGTGNSVRMQ